MRSSLIRFAIAGLASLAIATSASAAPVLNFSQQTPTGATEFIQGVTSGTTTTLTSVGIPGFSPTSISVGVTQIGTTQFIPAVPAFETVTATGTGPVIVSTGGVSKDGFSGTIQLTQGPGGTGVNLLTATFSGATLSGGASAALIAPTATFSTNNAIVAAALGLPPAGGTVTGLGTFSISLTNISPSLTFVSGSTFSSTQNSGVFSVIPEPSSIVMASISAFAGLGCFGVRRLKKFQA
jgi:hypothetical protein